MTGPSSGDRPAEETTGIVADHQPWCDPNCTLKQHRAMPATPLAVRTGDDYCGAEHTDSEGTWTCTLPSGHRSAHGAFDFDVQELHATWSNPSTPPPVPGTAPTPVPYDQHEREVLQLIDERDRLERIADRLAAAIAPADVLGEHSSDNNPWKNALDYAEERHGPVSGTATRDDVRRELARHSASARVVGNGSTYITCRCGHAIGSYFHGWGDPASHEAWELHRADALLALGGSQSTRPVQPAEEQRPIDLLTEQGDEGRVWVQLPAEDVAFIRGFDPDRDRTASRADMVRVVEHLQAALGDGGER